MTEWLGFAAAACTTFALLPQAILVWRRRSAGDVSLAMYVVMTAGVAMWIVYGWRIHSRPLVAANSVTLLLSLSVLAGKWRYGRAPGGA